MALYIPWKYATGGPQQPYEIGEETGDYRRDFLKITGPVKCEVRIQAQSLQYHIACSFYYMILLLANHPFNSS